MLLVLVVVVTDIHYRPLVLFSEETVAWRRISFLDNMNHLCTLFRFHLMVQKQLEGLSCMSYSV